MRNKTNYLLGALISNLGDGIQQIAIMWYIYKLTGNSLSIGLMIAIYYAPSLLLTPFVSVYVDHHKSKNIVIFIDIVRFVIVLSMSSLTFFRIESTLSFYFLQFLLAVCYTIYKPAEQSFIKESFYTKDIPSVMSKLTSLSEAALIAGSALSGILLVKLSLPVSFFINALTFLLAAICYWQVKQVNTKKIQTAKISFTSELKDGWHYINNMEGMKYLLFLSILNSISIQMVTTILLPLAKQFKGLSGLYSIFEISFSVGGIAAGILVPYFYKRLRHKVIIFTMTGMALSALILKVIPYPTLAAVLLVFFGLFTMAHLVTTQTLIQLNTSKNYIGRVAGFRTMLASSVKISSAVLTGALISSIGIQNILLLFSMIIFTAFLTLKKLKHVSIPQSLYT